jgi:hypothetical protein
MHHLRRGQTAHEQSVPGAIVRHTNLARHSRRTSDAQLMLAQRVRRNRCDVRNPPAPSRSPPGELSTEHAMLEEHAAGARRTLISPGEDGMQPELRFVWRGRSRRGAGHRPCPPCRRPAAGAACLATSWDLPPSVGCVKQPRRRRCTARECEPRARNDESNSDIEGGSRRGSSGEVFALLASRLRQH